MTPRIFKSALTLLALSFVLSSPVNAQNIDAIIAEAMANPARAEANSSRDAARKPGEVIKFMGVMPGHTVLDMISAGGFYTEILAGVVGDEGRVISHMFAGNGMDPDDAWANTIRQSAHLNNVVPIYADLNDLDLKENSLDSVFLIQNFHDFYFDRFAVDVERILAMYRKAVKPGGTIAIIDHHAGDGAPSTTGTTVHRIDPAIVKRDMAAAGFELTGELDILLNDTDDPSILVFDDAVRGKTSRFILRFRNPE